MYLHNYSTALNEWVLALHGVYALFGQVFVDDGFGNLKKSDLTPVCTFIVEECK